jgi:hypothetical protein
LSAPAGGLQLFQPLPAATEAALRESIARFGVLVPVVRDQYGRILDGHHRARLAAELGVAYRVDVLPVADEAEARDLVRALNGARRQLTRGQQRELAVFLRANGHSLRAIAQATDSRVRTVRRDLAAVPDGTPERARGLDGKSYPSRRKTVVPVRDEAEAGTVLAALTDIHRLPGSRVITPGRISRLARQQAAARARTDGVPAVTGSAGIEIRHGECDTIVAVPERTWKPYQVKVETETRVRVKAGGPA